MSQRSPQLYIPVQRPVYSPRRAAPGPDADLLTQIIPCSNRSLTIGPGAAASLGGSHTGGAAKPHPLPSVSVGRVSRSYRATGSHLLYGLELMRSSAGKTLRATVCRFPPRLRALAAPALLILATLAAPLAGLPRPAAAASSIPVLAVDADPSGNGPRAVGPIEDCVSTAPGQTVAVDIALPDPGVPAGRGIAAYQFNLFYDPAILSIADEDQGLLLDQAPGSTLFPISEATPDTNGIFFSGAADFGPKGIEPAGASETGPGVLVRLTLQPRAAGSSPLLLRDIILLDDGSQSISVDSVQTATVLVGQPCPGRSEGAPSAPVPSPAPTPSADPADPPPESPSGPTSLASTGGPPPGSGSLRGPIIALGAAPMLAGAALLLVRRRSAPRVVSALSRNKPGKVAGQPAAFPRRSHRSSDGR